MTLFTQKHYEYLMKELEPRILEALVPALEKDNPKFQRAKFLEKTDEKESNRPRRTSGVPTSRT